MSPEERTIRVDLLARVEGEGRFVLRVEDGRVVDAELSIFEAPRYFEALLRGRSLHEVPDIVARICGICPVAYQMSAVRALEDALGIVPSPEIRALRRLLYCGEWIESHALHVFLLHAPDFLGFESAIEMAMVVQGLELVTALVQSASGTQRTHRASPASESAMAAASASSSSMALAGPSEQAGRARASSLASAMQQRYRFRASCIHEPTV